MGCSGSKEERKPTANNSSLPSNDNANGMKAKSITVAASNNGNSTRNSNNHNGVDSNGVILETKSSPNDDSVDNLKLRAISKIQRTARRKIAMKVAHAENQWKMFADLDTQDEAEMLHLAVFMQTLMNTVPAMDRETEYNTLKGNLEEDSDNEGDVGDSNSIIKLSSIKFMESAHHDESTRTTLYEITQPKINSQVASEIIEVYRKGGKLSRKAVVKILRKAYKALQKQKNVTRLEVEQGCKLTVVGDLHGQLSDLLHIIDEAGMPSPTNKFVFNGDFVDRGEHGLEIVVILFAMYVAEGGNIVALNRGNHEDLPVCRVYGFEAEVKEKYDELLFEMFAEVFNYIPLFTLINKTVFIVHGGLFHTPEVTIDELDEIERSDYYVKPPIPYPMNTQGLSEEDARKEYLKQLQRDALWSDPTTEEGMFLNPRGAGISFGPDIAQRFMDLNKVSMVIRSHECVYKGYELSYSLCYSEISPRFHSKSIDGFMGSSKELSCPPGCPLLCTLFSASNYTDGDNDGAYIMFMSHRFNGSAPAGPGSDLFYTVNSYKTSASHGGLENSNQISLAEHIMKKKTALLNAFEAADVNNLGVISRIEWAEIMQRVTMIKIRWLAIISSIAPAECLSPNSVAYRIFLKSFSLEYRKQISKPGGEASPRLVDGDDTVIGAMDDMYGQRKKLETVFYFFDSNGDGVSTILF